MPLNLKTAFATYPHTAAIKSGTVTSPRLTLSLEDVPNITRAFRRMVRTLDFDLCEIALATLAQAHAKAIPITGLPIVIMRGFHHAALICLKAAPIENPHDLKGKRIGVRAWSQTTGVWVRGILLDEYNVDHRDITWITEEDNHVLGFTDPPNVQRLQPGQDLKTMLLHGEIDAAIALNGIDPALVRPVITDSPAGWYAKTGAYPVNHLLCVKTALIGQHPWLPDELLTLFIAAKAADTGADTLPYGLERNRTGIEYGLRYAAEQGLTPKQYTTQDLFAG